MLLEVLLQRTDTLVLRLLYLVGGNSGPQLDDLGKILHRDLNVLGFLLYLVNAVGGLCDLHFDLRHLFVVLVACFREFALVHAKFRQLGFQLFVLGYRRASKTCAGAGFVQQVDSLVRQESVVDIALRKHRAHTRYLRGNLHLVVLLVVFLDALKQLHGVLDGRLVDRYRLEAALQRAVLLDVLAVLVERGRAYNLEFPAGKRRLEHVSGVHGSLGISGADQVVYLVDEQDNVSGVLYLVDKGLHAALKLTSELRPRYKRSEVEQVKLLALEPERNVPACKLQRDTLGNGGLSDAWFADKAGIVLSPAGKYLDNSADLLVPADNAVDFTVLCTAGEVCAECFKSSALLVGLFLLFLRGLRFRFLVQLIHIVLAEGALERLEHLLEELRHGVCPALLEQFVLLVRVIGVINVIFGVIIVRIGVVRLESVRDVLEAYILEQFRIGIAVLVKHGIVGVLKILLGNTHLLEILVDLRKPHFLGASQAQTLVAALSTLH